MALFCAPIKIEGAAIARHTLASLRRIMLIYFNKCLVRLLLSEDYDTVPVVGAVGLYVGSVILDGQTVA